MSKPASPPTPNPAPSPAPISPDPSDPSYVTITSPDVRLCAGTISDRKFFKAYEPLPIGLRLPRFIVEQYWTECRSPEEWRDQAFAGGNGGDEEGLGAIQPGVPYRWNGRNWRRARQHNPERACRGRGLASG
jgi:hypothetical protein